MHCCPESTKCDLAHSKCVSPTLDTFPMREKVPARKSQSGTEGTDRNKLQDHQEVVFELCSRVVFIRAHKRKRKNQYSVS